MKFAVAIPARLESTRLPRKVLADIGGTLIVEFVEPHDPMADRLLGNKQAGLFPDYRIEEFERILGDRYQITSHLRLPSGSRTLYVGEPRR